ncbi:unnamed protein product [Adineta steineri]|uniref:Secreted protein n=1 Tax=Adineta steineri TaxID=433720 RepID=A0A819GEG3_9BILA|nr:unnamed protein product [Adineta steineri]CAF3880655.1 unnamed protein product [Adineta steineri]
MLFLGILPKHVLLLSISVMAQSQGYKRFLLSMNINHYGTNTPQTSKNRLLPRSSTPITHFPKKQHHIPHIYINRITVIQQQKSCHCKKRKLENILGIF